jgi:drug/metabolite transporter (DMT)-like permease
MPVREASPQVSVVPAASPFDARTVGALATTLLFWASAFAAIRVALQHYEPGHLALLRFLTASVALGIVAVIKRLPLPRGEDCLALIGSGFLSVTVYHTALNYGEVRVSAGAASFIINTAPICTALLASYFLRERLPLLAWCGIALSFSGVILIALGEGAGRLQSTLIEPGALLILLSAMAASGSLILNKNLVSRYSALQITSYTVWAGTFFLLFFMPGLTSAIQTKPLQITLWIVYLGVFPGALSFVTWTYALSRLSASRTASFLYGVPPIATFIAWLWIGEIPTIYALIGGVLALLGVVLVNAARPKAATAPLSE